MGTSKSYLPKVTKNTTQTKLNITNSIKHSGEKNQESLIKIVNSFKNSLAEDPSGLKNGNYASAISAISGIIAAISSSSVGGYVNSQLNDNDRYSIQSPQDLFNNAIRNNDYLTEFEKSNVLDAVSLTLENLKIDELEDLNLVNCDLFIKTFLLNLIYSLFISSYYEHINSKTNNPKETQSLCLDIKQYIEGRIMAENAITIELINNQSKMDEYARNVIDEVLSLL